MKAALQIATRLLSRHLSLLYPLLFFIMLISSLWPQEPVQLQWRWAALLGLIFLLQTAFSCGWLSVIAAAVLDALKPPTPPVDEFTRQSAEGRLPVFKSFSYFKTFFPGLGRYFLPVLGGYTIIYVIVGLLMVGGITWAIQQFGWPDSLNQLSHINTQAQLKTWLVSLSEAEKQQLSQLTLAAFASLFVGGLFLMATQFWMLFVMLLQNNPIKALVRSAGFFFRHLIPLLGFILPMGLAYTVCFQLQAADDGLLGVLWAFLAQVLQLFWVLFMTSYFCLHHGQAQLLPPDSGTLPENVLKNT